MTISDLTDHTVSNYNEAEEFNKKVERYMRCDKRTLAEMLALLDEKSTVITTPPVYPSYPWQNPWWNQPYYTTVTGDKDETLESLNNKSRSV